LIRAAAILAVAVACQGRETPPPAEPTPQKPAWQTPTPAACDTAIRKMREVMPEALDSDTAVDVADCMQLPAALVACLATIRNRDDAEGCVERSNESRPGPKP
jgi:hypothetical protein